MSEKVITKPMFPLNVRGMYRGDVDDTLHQLPRRAMLCFVTRSVKRFEPLADLQRVIPIAYAIGLVIPDRFAYRRYYPADAADATHAVDAAHSASDADAEDNTPASDAVIGYVASAVTSVADSDAAYAALNSDFQKLLSLNLGEPGTPGEPIHPLDPRLGPLWPNGEPEWSLEAKKLYRELSEKVRDLQPDPVMAPLSDSLKARMNAQLDLNDAYDRGKLDEYRGEHLIVGDGVILVHGKDLLKLRKKASTKAKKEGIPLDHLIEYYVDSLE